MSLIWSYIFGSMSFLLSSFFRAPTAEGFGPVKRKRLMERESDIDTYDELVDRDMLRINSRLVEMFIDTFTTCYIGVYFYMYPYLESD